MATPSDIQAAIARSAAVLNAIVRWLQRLRDTP